MAAIGPGLDPAHRDYDPRLITTYLSQLRSIILIDFSRIVTASASRSLVDGGVEEDRVHQVQLDITNGYSTVYSEYIQQKLSTVNDADEESLARVVEDMSKADVVGELWDRWKVYEERCKSKKKNSLNITSQGQPVPVDFFALNMVLAGTGAAADADFWEKYHAMRESTDRSQGIPNDDQLELRRKIITDYHSVITQYNTEAATKVLQVLLLAHPKARVHATSDHSTLFSKPLVLSPAVDPSYRSIGRLQRIDLTSVQSQLAALGIAVSFSDQIKPWIWNDEPEHSHEVISLVAESQKTKKQVGTPGDTKTNEGKSVA